MTLHEADAWLRSEYYGVRVIPVPERGRWPFKRCAFYGSAAEFDARWPCEGPPVRWVRYPGEEFWFVEDGVLCRTCYVLMADHERGQLT